jgi:hypothetical protein
MLEPEKMLVWALSRHHVTVSRRVTWEQQPVLFLGQRPQAVSGFISHAVAAIRVQGRCWRRWYISWVVQTEALHLGGFERLSYVLLVPDTRI